MRPQTSRMLVALFALFALVSSRTALAQCCTWLDPYADLGEQERSDIFWKGATAAGTAVALLEDSLAIPRSREDAPAQAKLDELARSAFLTWYEVFNGFKRRAPQEFADVSEWDDVILAATQALSDGGQAVVDGNDPEEAMRHIVEFRLLLGVLCERAGRPSLPAAIARARALVDAARSTAEGKGTIDVPVNGKLLKDAAGRLRDAPSWSSDEPQDKEQARNLADAFENERAEAVKLLEESADAIAGKDRDAAGKVLAECAADLQAFALAYGRPLF